MVRVIYKNLKPLLLKLRSSYHLSKVGQHQGKVYIGGKCRFNKNVTFGKNVSFNGMIVKGYGKVYFGDNFHSGTDCKILTSNHNYDTGKSLPYDHTNIIKDVIIEENVWFGDNVIVLPGVRIGEGAIIQAGSVVVRDIPALGIAGGNPAEVFKYRDKDHYYKLKSNDDLLRV